MSTWWADWHGRAGRQRIMAPGDDANPVRCWLPTTDLATRYSFMFDGYVRWSWTTRSCRGGWRDSSCALPDNAHVVPDLRRV